MEKGKLTTALQSTKLEYSANIRRRKTAKELSEVFIIHTDAAPMENYVTGRLQKLLYRQDEFIR